MNTTQRLFQKLGITFVRVTRKTENKQKKPQGSKIHPTEKPAYILNDIPRLNEKRQSMGSLVSTSETIPSK